MKITRNPFEGYRRIGFFGLGKSNLSLLARVPEDKEIILRSDAPIDRDLYRSDPRITGIFDASDAMRDITEELLLLSPSVKREREELSAAVLRGVRLSSDAELFFERVNAPVLAVSGSDGKSTTATLAYRILCESGMKAVLCGNVGMPMLDSIDDRAEIYVTELSSFMLKYLRIAPERAVLTNLSENHLDWHANAEEYYSVKLGLLRSAKECVINADDPRICKLEGARRVSIERRIIAGAGATVLAEDGIIHNGKRVISLSDITVGGRHNIMNTALAIALTDGYSTDEGILRAVKGFKGLAHRTETVLVHRGIRFIDSSIDTTPMRTAATLRSLGRGIVLIVGGKSKGLSYAPLIEEARKKVRHFIATGDAAEEISRALRRYIDGEIIKDFDAAVRAAAELAYPSETVLLSPAATSYDTFRSFEERSERFISIINEFKSKTL